MDEEQPPKKKPGIQTPEFYEASERNRWKKGQSGNPNGRPKGAKSRGTILKKYVSLTYKDKNGQTAEQPFGTDGEPLTVEELMELMQIRKALKGDTNAYKEIKDTIYGKNPDIVIPLDETPSAPEEKELKGEALVEELKKRGLPTQVLEE